MDHPTGGTPEDEPRPATGAPQDARVWIEKAARLAHLRLTPEETEVLGRDVANVVDHFASLSTVDVEGIDPMLGASREADVTRADEPRTGLASDAVLGCAPDAREGFYSVPKTIQERGGNG